MKTGSHQLANSDWAVADPMCERKGKTVEHAILAVLMDIREELRAITGRLDCSETLGIPSLLRRIVVNTRKPKRRKVAK